MPVRCYTCKSLPKTSKVEGPYELWRTECPQCGTLLALGNTPDESKGCWDRWIKTNIRHIPKKTSDITDNRTHRMSEKKQTGA